MNRVSLRIRIFLAMLLLVGLASMIIALITVGHYKDQTQDYYKSRIERKEMSVQKNVNFELENTIYPVSQNLLGIIFRDKITEIAAVHDMKVSIFDLNGTLQINSYDPWFKIFKERMPAKVLDYLKKKNEYKESATLENGKILQSSYFYIHNMSTKKVGVLKIEYIQDNSQEEEVLTSFLNKLFLVYGGMLILAVVFAYFLSSYITRSLSSISDKMQETKLLHKNEKIEVKGSTSEIASIIEAYNQMIDDLEESAEKLAKSEREQAWREMAKQVAHEIKNPLTPMKLTVQNFERTFDPNSDGIMEKVKDYSEMLTQQIDVMSSIATSFSDFARMPVKNIERIDVVKIVKSAIDIFYQDAIVFKTDNEEIFLNLDKNQMTRIVNNLVKNAMQATENIEKPVINVSLLEKENEVCLVVKDNGKGISIKDKEYIFEPKFTTKTSGMGLGLPMVKNIVETYNGKVDFNSVVGLGTEFMISFPK